MPEPCEKHSADVIEAYNKEAELHASRALAETILSIEGASEESIEIFRSLLRNSYIHGATTGVLILAKEVKAHAAAKQDAAASMQKSN